jgi:hypothetical protein
VQPPVLLLQSDWTAKVPVLSLTVLAAPWPDEIQAHLSPTSNATVVRELALVVSLGRIYRSHLDHLSPGVELVLL